MLEVWGAGPAVSTTQQSCLEREDAFYGSPHSAIYGSSKSKKLIIFCRSDEEQLIAA